jgi:hypothetical protein
MSKNEVSRGKQPAPGPTLAATTARPLSGHMLDIGTR